MFSSFLVVDFNMWSYFVIDLSYKTDIHSLIPYGGYTTPSKYLTSTRGSMASTTLNTSYKYLEQACWRSSRRRHQWQKRRWWQEKAAVINPSTAPSGQITWRHSVSGASRWCILSLPQKLHHAYLYSADDMTACDYVRQLKRICGPEGCETVIRISTNNKLSVITMGRVHIGSTCAWSRAP